MAAIDRHSILTFQAESNIAPRYYLPFQPRPSVYIKMNVLNAEYEEYLSLYANFSSHDCSCLPLFVVL
jgi:hypothetical protein